MKHLLKLVEEVLIERVKNGMFHSKGKKENGGGRKEGGKKETEGGRRDKEGVRRDVEGKEEGGKREEDEEIREGGGRRGGKVLMNKARIFQLIEIVRRIKTEEMVRFKFLRNFGVEGESVERMKKALLEEEVEAKRIMEELGEDEVWVVRIYLELCTEFLNGVKIHKGRREGGQFICIYIMFFILLMSNVFCL